MNKYKILILNVFLCVAYHTLPCGGPHFYEVGPSRTPSPAIQDLLFKPSLVRRVSTPFYAKFPGANYLPQESKRPGTPPILGDCKRPKTPVNFINNNSPVMPQPLRPLYVLNSIQEAGVSER